MTNELRKNTTYFNIVGQSKSTSLSAVFANSTKLFTPFRRNGLRTVDTFSTFSAEIRTLI